MLCVHNRVVVRGKDVLKCVVVASVRLWTFKDVRLIRTLYSQYAFMIIFNSLQNSIPFDPALLIRFI